MTSISRPRHRQAPLDPGKAYTLERQHGKLVAQARPMAYPSHPSAKAKQSRDWMRAMCKAYRKLPANERRTYERLAYPFHMKARDCFIGLSSGSMLYFVGPKGETIVGQAWADWMTHTLDIVAPGLGGLLVRYERGWWPMGAGEPGDFLRMTERGPGWSMLGGPWTKAEDTTAAADLSENLDEVSEEVGGIMYRAADSWHTIPPGKPGQYLGLAPDHRPRWAELDTFEQWRQQSIELDNQTRGPESVHPAEEHPQCALDTLGSYRNAIAYRSPTRWRSLRGSLPGYILALNQDALPHWTAPIA